MATSIRIKRLTSGWYYLRGAGPCQWAQVQQWPGCTEEELESAYFPEASPDFRMAKSGRNSGTFIGGGDLRW